MFVLPQKRALSSETEHSPLEAVRSVLASLIEVARGHGGLWPSCLSLEEHRIPTRAPGTIAGQREWDRSWDGCNLIYDLPALGLLYRLEEALEEETGYAEAADAYLSAFFAQCTDTPTGLFLWGEHAYWNLIADQPGDGSLRYPDPVPRRPDEQLMVHDHLRQAPPWFWKKVARIAPATLQRYADALDRHWINEERTEYNRHAILNQSQRLTRRERSCDFPRHSGHYIVDLACAYLGEAREATRVSLLRYADYWWSRYESGECLAVESRSPKGHGFYQELSTSQTLSLGVSLLEAALLLEPVDRELHRTLYERGRAYCRAFLSAPHHPQEGFFVSAYRRADRANPTPLPLMGSVYGTFPATQSALLCCAAYRILGEPGFLHWAEAVARTCTGAGEEGLRGIDCIPALDVGLLLELYADLGEITGQREWLAQGMAFWPWVRGAFFSNGLVRLAADGGWYESQQGSAYLLHGTARLGLASESAISIPPDYTAR